MAYDLHLADRIRAELGELPIAEKKMFGGVGFLLNGNLACGVNKNDLIVRVDPGRHTALLKKPRVRPFDMTGRPMKGWLVVEAEGVKTDKQLSRWLKEGLAFVSILPAK